MPKKKNNTLKKKPLIIALLDQLKIFLLFRHEVTLSLET